MKDLNAEQASAITADVVRPVVLVRLDFASGLVLVHSGVGTIEWGDDLYLGVGDLGSISQVSEGAELDRRTVTLGLTGIPTDTQDLVETALVANYQGRDARIYLALLDENYQLIGFPRMTFRGRIDVCSVEIGNTATVTVTVESRLADWDRARVQRYTNHEQQARFAGDLGMAFVSKMTELEIRWAVVD